MVWEPGGSPDFSWPSDVSFYQKVFKNIYWYILMYFEAFLADVYNFHVTCTTNSYLIYIFCAKSPVIYFNTMGWEPYGSTIFLWQRDGSFLSESVCLFLYVYFHVFWTSNTQFLSNMINCIKKSIFYLFFITNFVT